MALKINTNIAALNAHKSMVKNDDLLSDSLIRLSSGLRINKAADDSSGMAIADSLKAQSLGIGQAIRNANDGISIVQTADGALKESINIVNTIKTKAIQAASDGQTTATRRAIQNDIDKLLEELNTIAKTTSFNGQKLLSGAFTNKSFQIGAFSNETADVSIDSTESDKIGHISQAELKLASKEGGDVQLSITSSITGEVIKLSNINIAYNNKPANGMGSLADEINRYTSVTGISASAIVSTTTEVAVKAGTTGSDFTINGILIGAIPVDNNDASGSLVSAINKKSAETGVEAYGTPDGRLTLKSSDGRAIKVTGSVADVMGSTSGQLSTIGHLSLTQKGVSQFQISGIGAGATGAEIEVTGEMTTVEDSVLSSGSTIAAGSKMAANTIIGGDALVEATVNNTQLDYTLKTGSTLYWGSDLSQGTVLGANITVGGDRATSGAGGTYLGQNMLVSAGSRLEAGSVIGKDTVVTTDFQTAAGGPVYAAGTTLSSAVTLGSDLTLVADMTLAYNGASADNSRVQIGSSLNTGTVLGAEFKDIGLIYSSATDGSYFTQATEFATAVQTSGTDTVAASTSLMNLNTDFTTTVGNMTIKAGSLLASNSVLNLSTAGTTWTGPTLVTSAGVIEAGDTINPNTQYTLVGDQIISEDLNVNNAPGSAGTSTTLADGSVLTAGFMVTINAGTTLNISGVAANSNISSNIATLNEEMVIQSGSELQTGSKLLAGSKLGDNTYVMGGQLNASAQNLTTYTLTNLKAGSVLENESKLNEGSTIGGTLKVATNTTINSDMSLSAGTILKAGTLLKAGTIINQDITMNKDSALGSTTTVSISAGDVLTTDLYVQNDTTVAEDMLIKEKSVINANSELAINTRNAGTLGLGPVASYSLAEVSVLDQESAQRAISISDSALRGLDDIRSSLGSVQNQLSATISNLSVTKTNIQASESTIRDVDFAEESMVFSKMQLLAQTSSYALQQANASAQNVMSLLK